MREGAGISLGLESRNSEARVGFLREKEVAGGTECAGVLGKGGNFAGELIKRLGTRNVMCCRAC